MAQTISDSATFTEGYGGGEPVDTWHGVEVPAGHPPLSGSYSLAGDVSNVEVVLSAVLTESVEGIGDPGFHVHLRFPPENTGFTITATCTHQ